jgi:hypothetical protein
LLNEGCLTEQGVGQNTLKEESGGGGRLLQEPQLISSRSNHKRSSIQTRESNALLGLGLLNDAVIVNNNTTQVN